jgi:hypothetical protein
MPHWDVDIGGGDHLGAHEARGEHLDRKGFLSLHAVRLERLATSRGRKARICENAYFEVASELAIGLPETAAAVVLSGPFRPALPSLEPGW